MRVWMNLSRNIGDDIYPRQIKRGRSNERPLNLCSYLYFQNFNQPRSTQCCNSSAWGNEAGKGLRQ